MLAVLLLFFSLPLSYVASSYYEKSCSLCTKGWENEPLLNVAHLIFISLLLEYMHTQIVSQCDLSLC